MSVYVKKKNLRFVPFNCFFAAYQSESAFSCDGDVTSNLPGTLYLKKTCGKVTSGASELMEEGLIFFNP